MRICVLTSSYERSSSPFAALDTTADAARHLPEHQWTHVGLHKATSVRQLLSLSREPIDVFLNLCEGAWDEDRAGIEVVDALERMNLAFTGAGSAFFDPTREMMKRVCHYAGVATPRCGFVRSGEAAAALHPTLRFPMLVKHPNSYGSIELDRGALVHSVDALVARVERLVGIYGEALVEEFIAGREFTVLVAEPGEGEESPRVYVPVEVGFPPGESWKHFDMKWVDYHGMRWSPVTDDALAQRLGDASAALFTGLRGSGYGRCDLRVDEDGQVFMLEINPNCGIFGPQEDPASADVILQYDPAGHSGFLRHILDCALRRQERSRPAAHVQPMPGGGYGLVAARPLRAGAVVERHEERPTPLVSRQRAERWTGDKRRWFGPYTWPIGEGVYGMWDEDPTRWRPINHSCDPSCWLDGLDVVARRELAVGDEITLDYATFCGPEMTSFTCGCGAARCRGVIRGVDCDAPFLSEWYGPHLSPFVAARRQK